MKNEQSEVVGKKLNPTAESKVKDCTDDFVAALIFQSKTLAFCERTDEVQSIHVDQAFDSIVFNRKRRWINEIGKLLGAAFFGAFVSGFQPALSTGNTFTIAILTILGFAGLSLVFVCIMREK